MEDQAGEQNLDPFGERAWVEALVAGDAEAFRRLVRETGPRLLAVARRIVRDEEEARDCVQEAFLSAHRRLPKFEGRARLSTWLHRIVTNAGLMKLRARRSRPEEDSLDALMPRYDEVGFRIGAQRANPFDAETLLARSETAGQVRAALDTLPETARTILLLRDIEGYNTREVGELLGISDSAVKTRVHRARTALREKLSHLFEEEST